MGKSKKRRVRRRLEPYVGQQIRILARVGKLGRDRGDYKSNKLNLLLEEIHLAETSEFLCSHSWIPCNKKLRGSGALEGDIVGVRTKVIDYPTHCWSNKKKRFEWKIDYGFDYAHEVVLLERNDSFDDWLSS